MSEKANVQCPKCGSAQMWDNRASKKNPKAPDFKCVNASCDGVVWPPKPDKRSPVSAPPSNAPQPYSAGPHIPGIDGPYHETGAPPEMVEDREALTFALYDRCVDRVLSVTVPKMMKADVGTDPQSIAAMIATVFIRCTNRGLDA